MHTLGVEIGRVVASKLLEDEVQRMCGERPWLALAPIAACFGETDTWQANYRDFVAEKIDSTECLWDQLMNQIYLGGERWAASIRARVSGKGGQSF